MLYTSNKTYPHAMDSGKIKHIRAGTKIRGVAYRHYFDATKGYYMNNQNGNTVLYVDFHKPEKERLLELPAEILQKELKVIEKSDTVTFEKRADGVVFNSSGKYGYAVIHVM